MNLVKLKTAAFQEFPMATGDDSIALKVIDRIIIVLECLDEESKAAAKCLRWWPFLVCIKRVMFVKQISGVARGYPIVS